MLTCTCSHLRKEHEGGKDNRQDLSVRACMDKECKCSKYHNDYNSFKQIKKLENKIIKEVLLISLVGLVLVLAFDHAVNVLVSEYDIIDKETGLSYTNSTFNNETSIFQNDKMLSQGLSFLFGIGVFFFLLFFFVFYLEKNYYEEKIKLY